MKIDVQVVNIIITLKILCISILICALVAFGDSVQCGFHFFGFLCLRVVLDLTKVSYPCPHNSSAKEESS